MRRYLAEFIGTFVLVFGGCGAAVLDGKNIGVLGISLAFGLTLLTMAYAIGHVSGCHINPAVSIGLVVAKRHAASDLPGYIVGQLAGGIAASLLLTAIASGKDGYVLTPETLAANGYGDHSPGGYGLLAGALIEVSLTALLLFVVIGATDKLSPSGFAGLPIGLALALIHLIGIPVTNLSVNPARSIGPAVVARGWALEQIWLFVAAPIVGAVIGALLYRAIRPSEDKPPRERLAA